jgi:DNA-binding response OmpR family regulator
MKLIQSAKKATSKSAKLLMVSALGFSSLTLTGCDVGIDDFVTGITSNLCVFEGKCNGSTRM